MYYCFRKLEFDSLIRFWVILNYLETRPHVCTIFFSFKVQDKLRFDPESEIATTGLRVSLICPVSTHFWHGAYHSSASRSCLTHSFIYCIIATAFSSLFFFWQLVKMRLGVPCRVLTCAHLQCFDAVFFLQMNEKKPTWTCPVCDKPAPFELLTIDG